LTLSYARAHSIVGIRGFGIPHSVFLGITTV
jgi:hypothetical protein